MFARCDLFVSFFPSLGVVVFIQLVMYRCISLLMYFVRYFFIHVCPPLFIYFIYVYCLCIILGFFLSLLICLRISLLRDFCLYVCVCYVCLYFIVCVCFVCFVQLCMYVFLQLVIYVRPSARSFVSLVVRQLFLTYLFKHLLTDWV